MSRVKLFNDSVQVSCDDVGKILETCEAYREILVQYCLLYFEFEEEYAKDYVQNAYTSLYDNLRKGANITDYKAWLYKVVLND